MKNNRINLYADFSFITFMFLFFGTASFIGLDSNFLNLNVVILSITAMIMILTYFTSLVVGASACALVVFIGAATMLFFGLEKGFAIPNFVYFWGLMLPALTVCTAFLTKNTAKLQKTVVDLEKNIAELVTIDDLTGLKNQRQFMADTEAYMSISRRYKLKFALMVVEMRYQDDVERIVGKQNIGEIAVHLANAVVQSVRSEDLVYIVDTEHYSFAVLMITNDYEGIKVAVNRTKKRVSEINMNDIARFANVDLNMRIGYSTMEQDHKSALEFLDAAKHELEFDV